MPDGMSIKDFTRNVLAAVELAWQGWTTNLRVEKIELNLKTAASREGGLEFKIIPLGEDGKTNLFGFDGSLKDAVTQDLNIVLVRSGQESRFDAQGLRDSVQSAVDAIRQVIGELQTNINTPYDLSEAVVKLSLAVDRSGKLTVLFGNVSKADTITQGLTLLVKTQ